jgi:hypothetical protein
MRNRIPKQRGCAAGDGRDQRHRQPLPARAHVRLPRAIEHHFARGLNRTNARPRGKQRNQCKNNNEDNDNRARAHSPEIITLESGG